MAFSGKTGELSLAEILQLCLSDQRAGVVHIAISDKTFDLSFDKSKITAISSSHPPTNFRKILSGRKWISPDEAELQINDAETDILQALTQKKVITPEQAQYVRYHFAEEIFFDLLKNDTGSFTFSADQPELFYKFDIGFRDWISETIPDLHELTECRSILHDFDARIFWITPEQYQSVSEELSLEDIKILSRYRPKITVRNYWYTLSEPRRMIINTLIHLFNVDVFTFAPPQKGSKIPDSKPFLRMLLRILINRIEATASLVGSNGEIVEYLKSIADRLVEPSVTLLQSDSSEKNGDDDLTSITSTMEDLLSMESLDDLEFSEDKAEAAPSEPPAPSAAGKTEDTQSFTITGEFDASKKLEQDIPEIETLEDKVEAKVRYRRFVSNVTMNYNRLNMRNMNYFEMLGVPPNANRKAIHKAFTKIIRKINPKGIRLADKDKELLDRAVWVRDQLKEAYKTLMDPAQRRRYLANLRESREDEERRKSRALVLFNEGMIAFKAGQFDKARDIFMKAIKFDPNSPVYYNMLEEIRKKESSTKATKYFQGAILAYKKKNDPNRAIKLMKKAITLSPNQGIFYQKLAEIQASQPSTQVDAIQSYETALELDPGNMDLRLTVANYLLKIGRKQEAANRFQEIVKWNPDHTAARNALSALKKEGVVPKKSAVERQPESEEE